MLRAIGGTRGQVGRLVVLEGVIFAAIGVAVGILLGMLWTEMLALRFPDVFAAGALVSVGGIIFASVGSLLTALAASLLPRKMPDIPGVKHAATYLAAAEDPEAVREEGGAALAQAERLADVVSQLLDPARRGAAETASLTGIDEIIDQQVVEWEPAFRRSGRKVVVTGQRGLRAHVTPGGLAQVLATLVDNALMHGAGTVEIRTSQNTKSAVIEVEDQGKGVPPELVSRIFERSVSGRPEGTGLGLPLARTMAAADGGRVVLVRQRPPVFAVFLPRRPPASRSQPVRSGPA